MSNVTPTIDQIIDALDEGGIRAKSSRDGETVVIGYGHCGYLRLYPGTTISSGVEYPSVSIEGKVSGRAHRDIRNALEAAGIRGR